MNVRAMNHDDGLIPRASLTAQQREEMLDLLCAHFSGVEREQFECDLADKNWVIELRHAGVLLGFSTLFVGEVEWEGSIITVVFSGDTIVAPSAWGSPRLARQWISAVNRLCVPPRRCYWLLLTSGFRTYRFLPVFWREFYPRQNVATPESQQRLMSHLARWRYGGDYDECTGIVRFPKPQRLRGSLAELPEGRMADPDIAYFLRCNPGHANGDELVCLTEIGHENLTAAGRRMIEK